MAQAAGGGIAAGYSSSVDLSSPPSESEHQRSPTPPKQVDNNECASGNSPTIRVGSGVAGGGSHSNASALATVHAARHASPTPNPPQPQKVKRPRKRREPKDDAEKKEKSSKKPRVSTASTPISRKKPKLETISDSKDGVSSAMSRQAEITDIVSSHQPLGQKAFGAPTGPGSNSPIIHNTPIRLHDSLPSDQQPQTTYSSMHQPPLPVPRPSGLTYDPIRSISNQPPFSAAMPAATSSRPLYRASASPAISSIIDPPAPIMQSVLSPGDQAASQSAKTASEHSKPLSSPSHAHIVLAPSPSSPNHHSITDKDQTARELDRKSPATVSGPTELVKKASSGGPSTAPSPKPARAKEQPPSLPQGSGLLTSALFGAEVRSTLTKDDEKAPNIVLTIDLQGQNNRVINFARMAEEKYGFAALYPRLAAQKERLARVAAAGALLEKSATGGKLAGTSAGESGDEDMSVDIDRDSDNDGDIAMSGLNGDPGTAANSGTDGSKPKIRKPRKKVDKYDEDDPFVDDSEMAWEAQQAASKDGFFVYCGPLVPEGEKPALQRWVILLSYCTHHALTFGPEPTELRSVAAAEVEVVVLAPVGVEVESPPQQAALKLGLAEQVEGPAHEVAQPHVNQG